MEELFSAEKGFFYMILLEKKDHHFFQWVLFSIFEIIQKFSPKNDFWRELRRSLRSSSL